MTSPQETACDHAIAPFDRAAAAAERTWGVDRLIELVPPDMAARFGRLVGDLNAAIQNADPEKTAELAAIGIRAYARMDEAARAAGHVPLPDWQWPTEIEGRKYLIVAEARNWATIPEHRTVTLRELLIAFEAMPKIAQDVRNAIPGATISAVRARTRLEEELDDEIPF